MSSKVAPGHKSKHHQCEVLPVEEIVHVPFKHKMDTGHLLRCVNHALLRKHGRTAEGKRKASACWLVMRGFKELVDVARVAQTTKVVECKLVPTEKFTAEEFVKAVNEKKNSVSCSVVRGGVAAIFVGGFSTVKYCHRCKMTNPVFMQCPLAPTHRLCKRCALLLAAKSSDMKAIPGTWGCSVCDAMCDCASCLRSVGRGTILL